jgi:acetyl-CoA C-acetyltransferase
VRTPIGKFGGALADVDAVTLGIHAVRATLGRAGVAVDRVDETILGHARQAGCGPNSARQIAVRAGIPAERTAWTINQACLSGMQALLSAARLVQGGEARVVVAGGTESMSRVPFLLDAVRWGARMGHREL